MIETPALVHKWKINKLTPCQILLPHLYSSQRSLSQCERQIKGEKNGETAFKRTKKNIGNAIICIHVPQQLYFLNVAPKIQSSAVRKNKTVHIFANVPYFLINQFILFIYFLPKMKFVFSSIQILNPLQKFDSNKYFLCTPNRQYVGVNLSRHCHFSSFITSNSPLVINSVHHPEVSTLTCAMFSMPHSVTFYNLTSFQEHVEETF